MNSSVAFCCTCFQLASCASGTSASWPIANVLPACHFVFSCSARLRLRRPNKTSQAPESQPRRSEEHTSELQSPDHLVCRLLLEKKKKNRTMSTTTIPTCGSMNL